MTSNGSGKERLQKVLARAGVASRRRSEVIIAAGRVTVNGQVAAVGQLCTEHDEIALDGQRIQSSPSAYLHIALNKPSGIVSSLRSTHGEPTLTSLLQVPGRLFPAGRLDRDTHGLLLMTNDGEWMSLVTHPRYEIEKEYELLVRGSPSNPALSRLQTGVTLPDGDITAPAKVRVIESKGAMTQLSVTVIEGKKRQLRLMAAAVGHPVLDLVRVRVGPIRLGNLPLGEWRHLSSDEVEGVRAAANQSSRPSPPTPSPDRH